MSRFSKQPVQKAIGGKDMWTHDTHLEDYTLQETYIEKDYGLGQGGFKHTIRETWTLEYVNKNMCMWLKSHKSEEKTFFFFFNLKWINNASLQIDSRSPLPFHVWSSMVSFSTYLKSLTV
jgi:hypothetical protein